MGINKTDRLFIIAAAAITALLYFSYYFLQPSLDYSNCNLCDGNEYLRLYQYFKAGVAEPVKYPFYQRPLVPLIASTLPFDPLLSFKLISGIFAVLSIWILTDLWCRMGISRYLQLFGIFWLVLHWSGIVRFNLFDPLTVDVPVYFFSAGILWIVYTRRFIWAIPLAIVFAFTKESGLLFLGILLMTSFINSNNGKEKIYMIISVAIFTIILVFVEIYPSSVKSHNFPGYAILYHTKLFFAEPWRIVRFIAGFFTATGFFGMVLFTTKVKKDGYGISLFVLSITSVILGVIAGEDITRIIFIGLPFILTFLFYNSSSITSNWVFIFIFSIPFTRVHQVIPDFASEPSLEMRWFPEYAPIISIIPVLIYATTVIILYCILIRNNILK